MSRIDNGRLASHEWGLAPRKIWAQIMVPIVGMWILLTLILTLSAFTMSGSLENLKMQIDESSRVGELTMQLAQLRSSSRDLLLQFRITRNQSMQAELYKLNIERAELVDKLRKLPQLDNNQVRFLEQFNEASRRNRDIERLVLSEVEGKRLGEADRLLNVLGRLHKVSDAHLVDLMTYSKNLTLRAEQRMAQLFSNLMVVVGLLIVFSAVIIVVIALYYRQAILVPLNRLRLGFRAVTRGQYNFRLDENVVKGQMSEMIEDFNSMIQSLREMREELTVSREEAQKAATAKSEFLSNMSHEIRTPLNAVIGMADVLWDMNLDNESRNYLQVLRKSGQHLLHLVNDILDYSRLEEGKIQLETKPFDLHALISGMDCMVGALARGKGLALNVRKSLDVPAFVVGDENRLKQILLNLLGNSVKFTERGRVDLDINTCLTDRGKRLEFSVRDTGVGIPKDKLDRIFLRFSQADSGVTKVYGGTGLGLAISKQLVELMGGEIFVESELGKGSCFRFWIPMIETQRHVDFPAVDAQWEEKHMHNLEVFAGQRILLADDSVDNRVLVQALLKATDLKIDSVSNGLQAFELYKKNHYDLILMDMQMPIMDGYTAVREIRKFESAHGNGKRIPIVALTAYALREEMVRSSEAGCDFHLSKPFSKKQLLQVLHRYLSPRDNSPPVGEVHHI